jgi:hypothetical protein
MMLAFGDNMFEAISNFMIIGIFIIPTVYTVLMWSLFGGTIGMLILKLRVRSINTGKKPNLMVAAYRFLWWLISMFSLLTGFLWMFWDSRKQTFSDKLTHTIVIPTSERLMGIPIETTSDSRQWKVGKILAGISVLLFLVVFVIWIQQPPLNEDAKAALANYTPNENPGDNAFYLVAAFSAPQDVDVFNEGFKRVSELNRWTLKYIKDSKIPSKDDIEEIKALAIVDSLGPDVTSMSKILNAEDFLGWIIENKAIIKDTYKQYSYLTDRYQMIPGCKELRNVVLPYLMQPSFRYTSLVSYQRLFIANYLLEYMTGNRDKAIELMQKNDKANYFLFKNADTLKLKLVADICIAVNDYAIGKLLSYEKNIDLRLYQYMVEREVPVKADLSLRKAQNVEFTYRVASMLQNFGDTNALDDYVITPQEITRTSSPFARMNYITNHAWDTHAFLSDYSEKSFQEIDAEAGTGLVFNPDKLEFYRNPAGFTESYLFSWGSEKYMRYTTKLSDEFIYRILLQAKAEIKLRKLSGDQIQKFLDENTVEFLNPYKNEPFKWNPETNEIYFDSVNPNSDVKLRTLKI